GINTKGKATRNDLYDPTRPLDLLRAYLAFEADCVRREENGEDYDVDASRGTLDGVGFETFSDFSYFAVRFEEIRDRLEYKWYDPTFDLVEERLAAMETVGLA